MQGTLCYWRADVKLLMDDLAEFKPTMLMIVPRLLNRIYAEANATMSAKTGIAK